MKKILFIILLSVSTLVIGFQNTEADTTIPLSLTKLTGLTGGDPANTAVFVNLSGIPIPTIQSITIQDKSFGLGGATGQFSGFDLDAIKLSYYSAINAADVPDLPGLDVFDFSPTGTIFTPGTQRTPVDPKLFGTNSFGTKVDNSVATLGAFDANSSTSIPPAFGFVSMGDGGEISFNLTGPVDTTWNNKTLFLYLGEVGDNGEVIASSIIVRDTPVPDPDPDPVPEPASIMFLLGSVLGLAGLRKKFKK